MNSSTLHIRGLLEYLTVYNKFQEGKQESIFIPKEALEMLVDPVEIIGLLLLFVSFLFISQITGILKENLDSLPMRFAAVLLILGSLSYNKILALGVFLVVVAIYIQHHHDDVASVLGTANNIAAYNSTNTNNSPAINKLDHGGSADESYDSSDFTSKTEDQDNEFKTTGSSIDEKHALTTEQLGSKSQSLFPDDSKHVDAMEHGNRNGYSD